MPEFRMIFLNQVVLRFEIEGSVTLAVFSISNTSRRKAGQKPNCKPMFGALSGVFIMLGAAARLSEPGLPTRKSAIRCYTGCQTRMYSRLGCPQTILTTTSLSSSAQAFEVD